MDLKLKGRMAFVTGSTAGIGLAVASFLAQLLTGCTLTTMRSIHRTPDFRSSVIRHVLVIGHFSDQTNRKIFEEEFVRQWSRRGVQAESSLAVLGSSTTLSKAAVAPIAKVRGFDTVLVTRLLERKTIHPGEPAVPTIESTAQGDMKDLNAAWDILLAPAVSTSEFDLATVETDLYDVASERRLWSGRTETDLMQKIPKLIPPFVKLILKHLYKTS